MTISKSELANNNPASFTELPQNSDITGKHGGRAVKATPHPDKNIPLSYVWTIAAGVLLGLVKVTETAIQQKMCFDASNTRNCTCNTPPPVFNSVLPSILSPTDAPSTDAPSTDAPSTDDLPFLMTILFPLVALCAFSIGIGSVVYKRCRDSAHYADPLRVKIETSPEQQPERHELLPVRQQHPHTRVKAETSPGRQSEKYELLPVVQHPQILQAVPSDEMDESA